MITTVFRLSSTKFNVKKFLDYSRWKPIRYWLEGEEDRYRHEVNKSSGFNLDILGSRRYSKLEFQRHIDAIVLFIKENEVFLKKLKRQKTVEMSIDIGIIIEKELMISTSFKGEILKLVNQYNIELVVSFYLGRSSAERK